MTRAQVEEGRASAQGRIARRISKAGIEPVEGAVPMEEPLAIEINGQLVAVLMRTPGDEKALALGYCLSEGLIGSLSDVLLLHHCGSGQEELAFPSPALEGPLGPGNRVRLLLTPEARERLGAAGPPRWVFSGCGGVDAATLGAELQVGRRDLRVAPEALWGVVPAIAQAQSGYRATGGMHAAALADEAGNLLALSEDVGRHNAVDKVIGKAALEGRPPAAILAATGRASSDIVAKAARLGIPIVASFSSSTSLAVRLAEEAGLTLGGYLRRNRLTVYTHPERVVSAG
jgi:FdhD protein